MNGKYLMIQKYVSKGQDVIASCSLYAMGNGILYYLEVYHFMRSAFAHYNPNIIDNGHYLFNKSSAFDHPLTLNRFQMLVCNVKYTFGKTFAVSFRHASSVLLSWMSRTIKALTR